MIDAIGNYCKIFEFADGGTLHEHFEHSYHTLTWETKLSLGLNIANGLKHLHELKIVHKNLVLCYLF